MAPYFGVYMATIVLAVDRDSTVATIDESVQLFCDTTVTFVVRSVLWSW